MTAIDRALHTSLVRDVFELAAESLNQLHLLFGETARDAEDNTVATRNSHECEPDACISGGRLDDGGAGLEQPLFLGVENHPQRRTIFDGSARVEPFNFCVDAGEWWFRETGKMKKGSLAYQIQNTFCDAAL